jgi:peptide/nickel transport system substrate-binding protein
MRNRRRGRIGVALLIAVAVLVTACGSSSKKSSGGSGGSTAAKSDPAGIIKVGYDLQQESLQFSFDPAAATAAATANDALFNLLYGRLMQQNADGTLTPDLATSAKIVDKNTIDVVLRSGVVFSDGTPLDASAVKASLERDLANRAKNEVGFIAPFFSLKTIDVISPTELHLNIPDGTAASWFDQHISTWKTSITKPGATFTEIGAGPFKIQSHTPGQKIVMVKNDKYWNAKALKVAGMEFDQVAFAQPQAGVAALKQGQFDVVSTEPAQLPAPTGNVKPVSRTSPDQTATIMMCKADGPLADVRVRKAINKAIDRKAISEAAFGGTAEPATEPWPTGHKFNNPDVAKDLAYDVPGAKSLLKEANLGNISIDLYPLDFAGLLQAAEIIKQQLAVVGITVNLKTGVNFVSDFLVPQKHAMGLYPGNNSGAQKLTAYTGNSLGNICRYNNPEITDLYNQISKLSTSDPMTAELWQKADKIIVDNALSGFVLFRAALGGYNTDRLGDMTPEVLGQYIVPNPFKTYVKAKA